MLARAFVTIGFILDAAPALAQREIPNEGLRLQSVSLGTGYSDVELPPLTLGGSLPRNALDEDLISVVGIGLGWTRTTSATSVVFGLSGTYTNRIRYSEISAAGGALILGVSRSLTGRVKVSASGSTGLSNSDQAMFTPSPNEQLSTAQGTFENLSRSVALPRSRHPNPSQAALFVPIAESSLIASEAYGNRILTNSATAGISYSISRRSSIYFDSGYSSAQSVASSNEPGTIVTFPTTRAQVFSAGSALTLTRRTELSGSIVRARSTGVFEHETTSATVSFGWSGRRWFGQAGAGVALTPTPALDASLLPVTPETEGLEPLLPSRTPLPTYHFRMGYKTATQTFLAGHTRAPNDSQGFGSLTGPTLGADALWSWHPRRRTWETNASFTLFRTPGNFVHIYTWFVSARLTRPLTRQIRISAEYLFDRHGSKAFEGFHMVRQGFMFNLSWVPNKRLL
jgi:hypothetical protein